MSYLKFAMRLAAASLLVVACSAGTGPGASDGEGTFSSTSGNIDGTAFVPQSGFAHINADGTVALIFSNTPSVCDDTTRRVVHPGQVFVQAYDVKPLDRPEAKNGYFSEEVKIVRVASTCSAGADPTYDYASRGRGYALKLTIEELSARPVVGRFELEMLDQSAKVAFDFSVPTCADVDEPRACE